MGGATRDMAALPVLVDTARLTRSSAMPALSGIDNDCR